ncbi:epimerase [Terriglobus sp. RCC_193]|uniref:epimerase n=1 Tax=Terriglobus sp. RCC_193 TaxID=3239218 RepID=UPI003525A4F7
MRILIPGGSGQVGRVLARHLTEAGHQVTVLSRNPEPAPWQTLQWDGITEGPWVSELHRADAVIGLSGRIVNTRYTPKHRREILDSRILPTQLLGKLIAASPTPPRIWLNASTATIYRDAHDHAQDEFDGELGDRPFERGKRESASLPETYSFSVDVGAQWEEALFAETLPHTQRVALRTSLVMSPSPGSVFAVFSRITRLGLGGTQGSGEQHVSWMHELDFIRAINLLLTRPEITEETGGIINLAAPEAPINRRFMRTLRRAWHMPIGLPAPEFLMRPALWAIRTEPELVFKSRWVSPALLLKHGFQFRFPDWQSAATDLAARLKKS